MGHSGLDSQNQAKMELLGDSADLVQSYVLQQRTAVTNLITDTGRCR